jgi:hypothetical protein
MYLSSLLPKHSLSVVAFRADLDVVFDGNEFKKKKQRGRSYESLTLDQCLEIARNRKTLAIRS